MQAIITVAPPRAGKSTYAKSLQATHVEINRDNAREAITGLNRVDYYKQKARKIKQLENEVTEYCNHRMTQAAMSRRDIIISDTNLNTSLRESLIDRVESLGYDIVIKDDFDISWDELWKRNENSGTDYVKKSVMYSMWKRWLSYKGFKTYTPDQSLPKAVIFDVDGTLARMSPNRSPFDWKGVGDDTLITQNKLLLDAFRGAGLSIVIFTGRDGSCSDLTKDWLTKNGIVFDDFYIREEGDQRKDYIIKEEILWQAAEKWNFVGVVDDRPQVVNHWYDLGLHVWAVGDQRDNF